MKYCSKCGNELLDEAVICPKCGCVAGGADQVPDKLIADKRRSHLSAGLILNNIAAIGNAVIAAVFTYLLFSTRANRVQAISTWRSALTQSPLTRAGCPVRVGFLFGSR